MAEEEPVMLGALTSALSFFPVIGLAALGGLLSQKSGVWNLALEGVMAFGAFSGVLAYSLLGGFVWASLLFGFLVGLLVGALLSFLYVHLGLDQIVAGYGIWFVTEGLAGYLYYTVLPSVRVVETIGPIVLSLDAMFYLTFLSYAALYVVMRRTKYGLAITVVGENPRAADTAGINVRRVRDVCTTLGSGFASLAGSYLSLVILQGFTYKMVAGYGWTAFALVLFGRLRTESVLLGSLLFPLLIGFQTHLQVIGIEFIPPEFVVVLPHIGVLLTLVIAGAMGRKAGMPTALGVHYKRE